MSLGAVNGIESATDESVVDIKSPIEAIAAATEARGSGGSPNHFLFDHGSHVLLGKACLSQNRARMLAKPGRHAADFGRGI